MIQGFRRFLLLSVLAPIGAVCAAETAVDTTAMDTMAQSLSPPVGGIELVEDEQVRAPDPCLDGLSASSTARSTPLTAARACSDVIATLVGLIAPSPADTTALLSAYNNRAIARLRSGDLEGAAEDLGSAVTLDPGRWSTYLNRGNLHLAQNQPEAALADYARAQQLAPGPLPATLYNAVFAYRRMNDVDSAEQSLRASQNPLTGFNPSAADTDVPPGDRLR